MASVEGSDTYEPGVNKQLVQQQPVRIILLVEATAAAASGWSSTRKWLDVILQKLDMEVNALADVAQRQDPSQGANSKMPRVQYALIVYGVRDRSTPAPVQCSAWTSLRTELATWLDGIQFVGGVASKGTALPQALAEAIVLSKSPYPGGAKPAAPAASHPEAIPESDMNLPVHTHLVVCCPAFNPCRLPMVWPCAADTKARLFAAKFYHSFLEKFATLQAEKADRVMYGLCNQLDFIKGSLHQITPGTVDVWDLIMALPRHHLSLSVISSSLKSAASRTCLELFAYGNYPVSKLKLAVQRCVMCASSVGVGVYLSPRFIEGQRAFKPIWGKLLEKRKQMHQQAQLQQQQQRQQQQQAHSQGASTTGATVQQDGVQHAAKQTTQHAAHQASQQQQQQAIQQAAAQQQARQYKQQQAQVQQQQQQKAQQQHWQQASAHSAVATPPTAAATAASIASAGQVQQQRMATTQAAGMQQQQHQQQLLQQQQQQRFGVVPGGQGSAAVQPQQQQQQQQLSAQAGMGMGMTAAQAGIMSQQQPQQQQQPMVMLVQPGMQQMLVQQQAVAGFMQPQQLIPQQILQQQQQQQQMPMAVAQMASAPAAVVKQEKARVAFWSGQIVLNVPELNQQILAQVELSCSNPGAMKQTWAQRKHLVVHNIMHLQDVRQLLATYKSQITKVAYKVLQQGPIAWQWLQQQVNASPQKQVFMLVQLTSSYQGVIFFGNQAIKGQPATSYSMNEGSFILCGVDT